MRQCYYAIQFIGNDYGAGARQAQGGLGGRFRVFGAVSESVYDYNLAM